MHALLIAQYFPPDFVGTGTRAYNAAKGMKLMGYDVTVITAFPHYPHGNVPSKYRDKIIVQEEIEGIKIVRTWVPAGMPQSSNTKRLIVHISFILSSLLAFMFVRKVDIIFAMNPPFFSFFSAAVFKIILRKNIIRNVDDLWPEVWYQLGFVKSPLLRRILDYLSKISYTIPIALTPLSYGYINTLIDKYKIPKQKITVIEHGVDTTKFRIIDSKSFVKSKDKKMIVYSGALSIGYDFEPVLKAAKLLEKENIFFIIRGTGAIANDLQQMVVQYGLKNVEVRTDILTDEELIEFLNDADIFLLPMSFVNIIDTGLPTKTLEYQAIGKPIVCVSNGEAANYIERTKSGLVNTTRRPEDIAQLIMQLTKDDHLAESLGTNGLRHITNNLTIEKIGMRFGEVIARSLRV
jgi:colanic acid biosynthesis glycosyl transferase WcaI